MPQRMYTFKRDSGLLNIYETAESMFTKNHSLRSIFTAEIFRAINAGDMILIVPDTETIPYNLFEKGDK